MKIKTKKIIIYTFSLVLILSTVILTVAAAVSSYSYDINNNADVFKGFGAVIYLMLGAFFVLCETDFFVLYIILFLSRKQNSKRRLTFFQI